MSRPHPVARAAGAARAFVFLAAALAGCSAGSLSPFFGGETREASRKPANATEYRCEGGVSLYVRQLEGAIWLIAPDREIRLDKKAEGRYAFGRVELDMDKDRLDLIDPPTNQVNCKPVGGTTSPRL